jgi:hypothetical protein
MGLTLDSEGIFSLSVTLIQVFEASSNRLSVDSVLGRKVALPNAGAHSAPYCFDVCV